MNLRITIISMAAAVILAANADDNMRPVIYVNSNVTTHIIMPEHLKMVDISTDMIAGDQCTDNMVRLKPILPDSISGDDDFFDDSQFMGTITLIGERHMSQYDLIYDSRPEKAASMYKVKYDDGVNYTNPGTAMPESEMANYAWAICNSKRKYNSVRSNAYGINASVFNIYSIGDYFFIDLYLKNKTNITYDIAQMRVSLTDKKETKATNSQTIELTPAFVLNNNVRFKKDFRQVVVLDKLTFPEEKILNIEISEDQISGRVITIPIEYEDILNADCFDKTKLAAYEKVAQENRSLYGEIKRLNKEIREKNRSLDKANREINTLGGKLKKTNRQYIMIGKKLNALQEINKRFKDIDEDIAIDEMVRDNEDSSDGDIALE